ncbi:MAG TPA: lytic transglycosylase domain-containing protein [Chthoniobacterales bacterium]|nr:lytic transglycosylase domain-containing protein [Chthoniobacterales bacterium]
MRFILKLLICGILAGAAGVGYLALRSGDLVYTAHEWISPGRFQQHDALIREVAAQHGIDPMLVKAVVWRESRFDAHKFGTAGERGLMQVSERAAQEWAEQSRVANFQVEELFDPKVNVQAGTWYLARALGHWREQSDPMPFALAEYNAGASRAQRWAGGSAAGVISPDTFRENIDFPGTRKYIESILARYDFYRHRGRM